MLRSRIIPCLLLRDKGLVKTVKFDDYKYVGDPINAVRIFNEKEVDELMLIDIDATAKNKEPDYDQIKKIAMEARMPLCYGGGVKSSEQAKKIISLGFEKVSISSACVENLSLLGEIAKVIGSQSVVVTLDVLRTGLLKKYEVVTHNAKNRTGIDPIEFAKKLNKIGIGELVVNSVDKDGTLEGYDYKLNDKIRDVFNGPLTILGGAGSFDDLKKAIDYYVTIGVSAGSIFVFKGKYKAVLIQYPEARI